MTDTALIGELKALRIGPDEILIIHLPDDADIEEADAIAGVLKDLGLGERSLVMIGEMEFAVAKK